MILEFIFLVVAFVAIASFFWACANFYWNYAQARKLRDESLTEYELAQRKSFLAQVKPLLETVVRYNRRFQVSRGWMDESHFRYDTLLVRAGTPGKLSSEEFLALKQVAPLSLLLILLIFQVNIPTLVAILCFFSYFLPDLWLNDQARTRRTSIVRSLPDALDTFSLMVQAGLDFGQAVDIYIRTSEAAPLVAEFSFAQSQMRLGMSRTEALQAMSQRVDCLPLTNFTTAVIQSEKTGTSVANVLSSQGNELRTKRFQIAEEMGQKATIKMLMPLLLLILPNVFIVLFAPMALRYLAH